VELTHHGEFPQLLCLSSLMQGSCKCGLTCLSLSFILAAAAGHFLRFLVEFLTEKCLFITEGSRSVN
jgi:hypothetical protein